MIMCILTACANNCWYCTSPGTCSPFGCYPYDNKFSYVFGDRYNPCVGKYELA